MVLQNTPDAVYTLVPGANGAEHAAIASAAGGQAIILREENNARAKHFRARTTTESAPTNRSVTDIERKSQFFHEKYCSAD